MFKVHSSASTRVERSLGLLRSSASKGPIFRLLLDEFRVGFASGLELTCAGSAAASVMLSYFWASFGGFAATPESAPSQPQTQPKSNLNPEYLPFAEPNSN